MNGDEQRKAIERGCRILYCECGSFIPIDVQQLQSGNPYRCIVCAIKAALLTVGVKV